eukprot:g88.t1
MPFWCNTSPEQLAEAEGRLLSHIEGLKVSDVALSDERNHIHTIEYRTEGEAAAASKQRAPIVCCHGYGLGCAAFSHAIQPLSRVFNRVFSIDMLGFGRSSRPSWRATGVDEAEAFFTESLEDWRRAQGLEKMTLLGHSIGGYLAVAYAERYPERVEQLVLASPVGVPPAPDPVEAEARLAQRPLKWRLLVGTFRTLWGRGWSPQSIVRGAGPWGRDIVDKFVQRRFHDDMPTDKEQLADYIYHMSAQRGSGEYALPELLEPGAWAKRPLHTRIPSLGMPVHFVYGSRDWMDYTAAEAVTARMPHVITTVQRVPKAGHNLTLENPVGFAEMVAAACSGKIAPAEGRGGITRAGIRT